MARAALSAAIFLAAVPGAGCPAAANTGPCPLVWTDHPATTVTIGWRRTGGAFTEVQYRVTGTPGAWQAKTGLVSRPPENALRGVAHVRDNSLVKLTVPAPAREKPLSLIAGGDARRTTAANHRARVDGMKPVSRTRPLFVRFSGDFMTAGTFGERPVWLHQGQLTRAHEGVGTRSFHDFSTGTSGPITAEGDWDGIARLPVHPAPYAGRDICLASRDGDAGATARQWVVNDAGFGAPAVDAVPVKAAGTLRVATFNVRLADRGAGALVNDLATGTDSQARGVAEIIQRVAPDAVLLNEFDYDPAGRAIAHLKALYLGVSQNGAPPIRYPYHYVAISNTGVQPESEGGPDCDFNDPDAGCGEGGANDDPEDAYGFGNYPGVFGMALLSRYPIDTANIRTFRRFLWQDMPGAVLPAGYYQPDELDIFRLSSKSHWDIPVVVKGQRLHLLASHPTPPVFDGPEDRNGRRNHDEIRFWQDYVERTGSDCYITDDDGVPGCLGAGRRFVILGDQNADPVNGDSFAGAIHQLLKSPRVDAGFVPMAGGGVGTRSGLTATADFGLRADYVLPSAAGLDSVMDACDPAEPGLSCGIFWPRRIHPLARLTGRCPGSGPSCASSDHRLVWLDLAVVGDEDDDNLTAARRGTGPGVADDAGTALFSVSLEEPQEGIPLPARAGIPD